MRNSLAHAAWLELRMAGVIRHEDYTAATLRDLAAHLDTMPVPETADAFADAVAAWLDARRLRAAGATEARARAVAAAAWTAIMEYLRRPLPPLALTQELVQDAAYALEYYVHAWNLSLNPEDLGEMAYAMLARLGVETLSGAPEAGPEAGGAGDGALDGRAD